MKGLCRRAKAGSSREMVDFLFLLDLSGDERSHENGDDDSEDDDFLLLLLLPPELLMGLVGVDISVVGDDDDVVMVVSMLPEPEGDGLENFHLLKLMVMTSLARSPR